jgi:hypothetical protein
MNTLTKDTGTIVTIPGSPGVPGNPGRPAVPARCWNETYTETVYSVTDPAGAEYADLDGDGFPELLPSGDSITVTSNPVITSTVVTRVRQVCSPAIPGIPPTAPRPATPAQTIETGGIGWNARARSIASSVGSFNIRFEVPEGSIGVIVGVTDMPDASSGYADILYGLFVQRGQAQLILSGNAGVTVPFGVFGLRMVNGTLDVLVDDAIEYSTSVAYNPSTQYWMAAAMYAGSDQVLNAEFLTTGGSPDPEPYVEGGDNFGQLAPLTGIGYEDGAEVQGGTSRLQPLQVIARMFSGGGSTLAPLETFGGTVPYGFGQSLLEPLRGGGSGPGFLTPAYAFGITYLMPLTGGGTGSMGNTGEGESRLLPLTGLGGQGPYGQGRSLLAPLYGGGAAIPADEAHLFSVMPMGAPASGDLVVYVAFTSSLELAGTVVATITQDGAVVSSLSVDDSLASAADIEALLLSVLGLPTFNALEAGEQWAVTDGKQVSRYTGYGFNSFATIDGKHYGAKADGIYLLEGATDAGTDIDVGMVLGKLDFGTAKHKRVENVYVGVSTTKALYLKVTAEGQTYTYQARSVSPKLQQQRFDPGKGLRANFFEFELIGKGQVEISGVEFRAVPLSRRI